MVHHDQPRPETAERTAPPGRDAATLISAARVIAHPETAPVEPGAVLVQGTTLTAVGAADELAARFPTAVRLDFPNATVIPGLINAHVHLSFDVTTDPGPAFERGDTDTIWRTITTNARSVLDGGVTTVRDLGDQAGLVAAFRDRVRRGEVLGPRVLTALSPLTKPEGHCWFLGGEVDIGPQGSVGARGVIQAAVNQRADAGADLIKVMASGGALTPTGAPMWRSQFTEWDLETIVEAARERDLSVAAHAHGAEAMARCTRVGVASLEHGSWLTPPDSDGGAMGYAPSEEVAELLVRSGTVIVPTRARGWENWPDEAGLDRMLAKLAWNDARGIQMIAGNDAGVGQVYFDDLVDTLTLFKAAGLSAQRAVATATTAAAAALGQADRIGSLAPGHSADLVVLDGNPLNDLHTLKHVRRVMLDGRLHDPTGDQLQ
jgi:imidazolonepropionase-like amidohydrolase